MLIVEKARTRILDGYGETHHVIPTSLGGSNTKQNKVKLTAREHFICHHLLTKMVESKDHMHKMAHAWWFFLGNNKHREIKINSRLYNEMRRLKSEAASQPQKREHVEKRAAANTGKKRNEEQKRNLHAGQEKYYATANKVELQARGQKAAATRTKNGTNLGGRPKGIPNVKASCVYCRKETIVSSIKQHHGKCV